MPFVPPRSSYSNFCSLELVQHHANGMGRIHNPYRYSLTSIKNFMIFYHETHYIVRRSKDPRRKRRGFCREAVCYVGGICPPNPLTRMPFLPTASSGASWHDFVKCKRTISTGAGQSQELIGATWRCSY